MPYLIKLSLYIILSLLASPSFAEEALSFSLDSYTYLFDGSQRSISIDPKDLTEVAYAFAEGTSKSNQHFGHSLLRLNMQNPDRVFYISFSRSFVGPTNEKGEHYVSRAFLLPEHSVTTEYSTKDDRRVYIYPLTLLPEEKVRLLKEFHKVASSHFGEYGVFLNSCVHGVGRVIAAAMNPERKFNPELPFLTPALFAGVLQGIGLIKQKFSLLHGSSHCRKEAIKDLAEKSGILAEDLRKADAGSAAERHPLWEEILQKSDGCLFAIMTLERLHREEIWIMGTKAYKKKMATTNDDPIEIVKKIRKEIDFLTFPILVFEKKHASSHYSSRINDAIDPKAQSS